MEHIHRVRNLRPDRVDVKRSAESESECVWISGNGSWEGWDLYVLFVVACSVCMYVMAQSRLVSVMERLRCIQFGQQWDGTRNSVEFEICLKIEE